MKFYDQLTVLKRSNHYMYVFCRDLHKKLELQIHKHHRIYHTFDTFNHLLGPIVGLGGANKWAFAILTNISKSLFKNG